VANKVIRCSHCGCTHAPERIRIRNYCSIRCRVAAHRANKKNLVDLSINDNNLIGEQDETQRRNRPIRTTNPIT
jgi:hypothetical protein